MQHGKYPTATRRWSRCDRSGVALSPGLFVVGRPRNIRSLIQLETGLPLRAGSPWRTTMSAALRRIMTEARGRTWGEAGSGTHTFQPSPVGEVLSEDRGHLVEPCRGPDLSVEVAVNVRVDQDFAHRPIRSSYNDSLVQHRPRAALPGAAASERMNARALRAADASSWRRPGSAPVSTLSSASRMSSASVTPR